MKPARIIVLGRPIAWRERETIVHDSEWIPSSCMREPHTILWVGPGRRPASGSISSAETAIEYKGLGSKLLDEEGFLERFSDILLPEMLIDTISVEVGGRAVDTGPMMTSNPATQH